MEKHSLDYNQQSCQGKVWLLGAGPGDIGLLTCKAKEVLKRAEVVIFDALISTEILALMPECAEKINAGKRAGNHTLSQLEINQILLTKALEGKQVVRLKGGDPFVFGRGGEELELLVEHGIAFEVVPGVTSAVAVPAYAGIPVTHRSMTSSFHIITGHAMQGKESQIDYHSLVKMNATLIFLMGLSSLPSICEGLLQAGMDKNMPASVISYGTVARQKKVLASIDTLVEKTKQAGITAPAIIIVGFVCALSEKYDWLETCPLGKKSVLVTRPADRISEMAEKLRFLGAQVIEMPLIRTERLKHNKKLKGVLKQISQIKEEVWLVFTSPSGIRIFFEQLKEWKLDLRKVFSSQIKIAVLGSGTKKELANYGFFADIMPKEYSAAALGDLLSKIWKEQKIYQKKLYIIRAKNGSKDLIKPLLKAGIVYEDIPLYETVFVENKLLAEKVKEILLQGMLDFITFTSASIVRSFIKAMEFCEEEKDYLKNFYAVCIGEKTAEEAKKYGMNILISKKAEIDSMVETIKEYRKKGEKNKKE